MPHPCANSAGRGVERAFSPANLATPTGVPAEPDKREWRESLIFLKKGGLFYGKVHRKCIFISNAKK